MNNDRRKEIARIKAMLEEKLTEVLQEAQNDLEAVRDEEQDYRDNMPEGIAMGEKGDRADEVIGKLDEAINVLDEFDVDELVNMLDEAAE